MSRCRKVTQLTNASCRLLRRQRSLLCHRLKEWYGRVPMIVPEGEFIHVGLKVLPRNIAISPLQRGFQKSPKPLDSIGVNPTVLGPLPDAVLHGGMKIAKIAQTGVTPVFIRENDRPRMHMRLKKGDDRLGSGISRCLSNYLTTPFYNANHGSLPLSASPTPTSASTSKVGFIGFHRKVQHPRIILEQFPNLMRHTPRRLVRDSKLSLQLLSRDTIARTCKEKDGMKPQF